jgi:hypothetical protein
MTKVLKIWIGTLAFLLQTNLVPAQFGTVSLNNESCIRLEKAHIDQPGFFSGIKPYSNSSKSLSDSIDLVLQIQNLNRFWGKLLNSEMNVFVKENSVLNISPIFSVMQEYRISEKQFSGSFIAGLSFDGSLGKNLTYRLNFIYGQRAYSQAQTSKIDSIGSLPFIGRFFIGKNGNHHFVLPTGELVYQPAPFLELNIGRGNHFWGDGSRSLFMSDLTAPYPFFQTNIQVWKFKYTWLFGALTDKNPEFSDNRFRTKLLISHLLSYDVTKWLNISFFESVVANPVDSAGITHFNPGYLNPVIFLRPVEFASGSADNVLLGLGVKIKPARKFHFYGQLVLDELIVSQLIKQKDWWGNKFGFQAGLKTFDLFGIQNLFTRMEYNLVRPYTYSYYNSFGNYGSHSLPLAHPLGANFKEIVFEAHYHYRRFSIFGAWSSALTGIDYNNQSFGQDIYKSNRLRPDDYNIHIGQGQKQAINDLSIKLSWILNPKLSLSLFLSGNMKQYPSIFPFKNARYFTFGIESLLLKNRLNGY